MPELRVKDCMHTGVVSCPPEGSLEEVAAIMRERRISAVVVMEGGGAAGIISQTDLVNASFVQPYLRYWRGMTARHLMTTPVIAIHADAPLEDALLLLEAHRIHRLIVTEPTAAGEHPVGILSLTDIARALGTRPPDAERPPPKNTP